MLISEAVFINADSSVVPDTMINLLLSMLTVDGRIDTPSPSFEYFKPFVNLPPVHQKLSPYLTVILP
jgi:hypothetical protein